MSQGARVALVTGGAQGIGRSFIEFLLAAGYSVALCDVNKQTGEATVKELDKQYPGKIIFLECDVTNDKQFEDCFKAAKDKFTGIDLVINNAGIANERDPGWKKMVDINFVAVVRGTQLGMKYMSKQNGGRGGTVINIASITFLEPFPSIPVYSATKAAVNQYSRSIGSDLHFFKTGVKVLAINPGKTRTIFNEQTPDQAFDDQETIDHYTKQAATYYLQDVSNMGKGLMEVLEKGQNGSLWTIDKDQPPELTIIK